MIKSLAKGGNEMNLIKCALALMLCLSLMALPALGASNVPGDSNGDKIISADEVAAVEKLTKEGKLSDR
jgi:hypothetical protein